jgi:phosphoribosyl 1,2-cyclic phosphodiesterase
MITHTHSDHVGSLGTLMLYAFAVKKIDVAVIIDGNMDYLPALRSLLEIYGLNKQMYHFADAADFSGKYSLFNKIRYVKTKHVEELETCAIAFETDDGLVFYSGDINNLAPIIDILKSGSPIDKIYVDTNNDRQPNPHHISIHGLNEIVPPELKPRIYCMHLQNSQCIGEAQSYGFQIVKLNGI